MLMGYPNLELLEYKTRDILYTLDADKYKNIELMVEVFPQTWGSTALGFGGIGGQVITTAYTTVFYNVLEDVAVVYFGNRVAYYVDHLNDIFINDLKYRDMKSVSEALMRYK